MKKIYTLKDRIFTLNFEYKARTYLANNNIYLVDQLVQQKKEQIKEALNSASSYAAFQERIETAQIKFDEELTEEELEKRLKEREELYLEMQAKETRNGLVELLIPLDANIFEFSEKLTYSILAPLTDIGNIHTLRDLLATTDWNLLEIPHIGVTSVERILNEVHQTGLLFDHELSERALENRKKIQSPKAKTKVKIIAR